MSNWWLSASSLPYSGLITLIIESNEVLSFNINLESG